MKRQRFFPATRSAEPEWFTNFANKVTTHATAGLTGGVLHL